LHLRTQKPAVVHLKEAGHPSDLETYGTILDAWDDGYDSVSFLSRDGRQSTVVKDPAQLRSRFAVFDPAKRNSRDLLAGISLFGFEPAQPPARPAASRLTPAP
jgi:hypothetical protein